MSDGTRPTYATNAILPQPGYFRPCPSPRVGLLWPYYTSEAGRFPGRDGRRCLSFHPKHQEPIVRTAHYETDKQLRRMGQLMQNSL